MSDTPLFDELTRRWHPSPSPVPRTAPASAVQVLEQGGILRAAEVVELAAGLDLAAAATLLIKESGGGRNVWGSDAVATAGTYVKGAEVTKATYLAYRDAVRAGRAGRQGCGPTQLTYYAFQDRADALGGCWDWRVNVRVGFDILAAGIKANGLRTGFRAYNGSGTAAESYADDAMAKYQAWKAQLAGAVAPPPAPSPVIKEPDVAMMTWVLPAGKDQERTIPVPIFDPNKAAVLWMVTGYGAAEFRGLTFVRDKGPGQTPQQEGWGGAGPFTLVPDDRPSWPLPTGCTSIGAAYDSEHDIAVMIVHPAI